MSSYAEAWHAWLFWLDAQIPDSLLAALSIVLLSLVALSKVALLFSIDYRPSILLSSADACLLAWSCSRISRKLIEFRTSPEHVFLHYALAVYAIYNLAYLWGLWRKSRDLRTLVGVQG